MGETKRTKEIEDTIKKSKSEVWKPIKGYNGYEVSNKGRIRSYKKRGSGQTQPKTPQIITTFEKNKRYKTFTAYNLKKNTLYVHRCVAEAFISNPENKPEVNHKDKNRYNNDLTNLEWVTRLENVLHSMGKKRRVPNVCNDRDSFRVHYVTDGRRTSKNFKNYEDALDFSKHIYK